MIISLLGGGVIIKKDDITVEPEPPIDIPWTPLEPSTPIKPPIEPEIPVNVPSKVTINGIAEVGETLTSVINDPNGVSNEVNYQWFDGADIIGFDSSYIVRITDIGKQISLTVTFTDNDGFDEVATSAKTALIPPLPPVNSFASVTIQGVIEVDEILSCTIIDANGVPIEISYQWLADGVVVGTAKTYTLKLTDKGKLISVRVAFSDNDGFIETAISAKTTPVIHNIPWTPLEPSTPIEPPVVEPEPIASIWYGLDDLTTFKGVDNDISIVDGVMNLKSGKTSTSIGIEHNVNYHQTVIQLGKTYKMSFDIKGTRLSSLVPSGRYWNIYLNDGVTAKEIWGKFEYSNVYESKEFIITTKFNMTKGNFKIFGVCRI